MSTPSIPTVDDIVNSFPEPSISSISGEPNYADIKRVHDTLKNNATSVPSTLGGGAHGHLGLIMNDATYQTLTNNPFVIPANPGNGPVIAANSTQAQIGAATRQYNQLYKCFHTCTRVDLALKQQIIQAFDSTYLESQKDPNTGYNNVSALGMITELYDLYGAIDAVDLENNAMRMKTPWQPTSPITVLFKQIEDGLNFATAGSQPISVEQSINTAYLLIFATGHFSEECKQWNAKPPVQKTWPNFKRHFTKAYKDLKAMHKLQASLGTGVQFGANSIIPAAVYNAATEYHRETTEAIHSLVNATQADRATVAQLSSANATLTSQVASLQTMLSNLQATLSSMQANNNNGTNNNNNRNNCPFSRDYEPNSKHYCWTHGLTRRRGHTSANCRNKDEGHQDDATFRDRKGGSNAFCDQA